MADWHLDVGLWSGAPQRRLSEAKAISANFRLASASELSFALNARRPQAGFVTPKVSDVQAYRNGELLYTGRVGTPTDNPSASQHDRTFATADYRALLARRIWTGAQTTWSGEQANVVKALVDRTQSVAGGNLGIDTSGLPTTGSAASRTTEIGAGIGQEIDALASAADAASSSTAGFDWDVAPGWGSARRLRLWYPYRGSDRQPLPYRWLESATQRESSRIRTLSRSDDPANFCNAVLVTGGVKSVTTATTYVNPTTGLTQVSTETKQVPTTPVYLAVADLAMRPEGLWPVSLSFPDIVEQAELQAKAGERLAALSGAASSSYQVTLVNGTWRGPSDLWLGDRVQLRVSSGVLVEAVTLRVTEIAVTVGTDGSEDVTLTLGEKPLDLGQTLRGFARRIETMELRP